jgi:outer membrane lipoprotein LolB
MNRLKQVARLALSLALLVLAGCAGVAPREAPPAAPVVVSEQARQAEAARQAWLAAHPDWSFQGRAAVAKGRNGGSGRVDWRQDGARYRIQLSAPVTRQSWVLDGDAVSGAGRLEGLEGGPRAGADAEQVLLAATGWQIPVNRLSAWVTGAVDAADVAVVALDPQGRPRTLQQQGWTVELQEWTEAADGLPALPRRIEARMGDAKVRLMLDQWQFGSP